MNCRYIISTYNRFLLKICIRDIHTQATRQYYTSNFLWIFTHLTGIHVHKFNPIVFINIFTNLQSYYFSIQFINILFYCFTAPSQIRFLEFPTHLSNRPKIPSSTWKASNPRVKPGIYVEIPWWEFTFT